MKKLLYAVLALAILPSLASAQWSQILRDNFNGSGGVTTTPAQAPAGDFTANLNFNYTTSAVPALPIPTGGDGTGFFLTTNESAGALSTSYLLLGNATDTTQAVETIMCPYLSTNCTGGTTVFGGVAVRASGPANSLLASGYWIDWRTDTSGTYGNYFNFNKRLSGGSTELLGRYYSIVGSGGVVAGSLTSPNESRAIKDPQVTAMNTWVKVRLEAEDVTGGTQIRVIIDDVTVVNYLDTTPVPAGQGALLVDDPFTSLSAPAATVGIIYDYVKYDGPGSAVNDWTLF